MCDVDALAISSVQFITNTTAFPDEILAHRLGMIPLEHSNHQKAEYTLAIRDYEGDVFSDGITPTKDAPGVLKGIFLLPMQRDQVLHVRAYAHRGIPSQHARYGTCVATAYAIAHSGGPPEECMCDGTECNTRCAKCGRMTATSDIVARGEIVHRFSFETTGVNPELILQRALQILHSKVTGLQAALTCSDHTKL